MSDSLSRFSPAGLALSVTLAGCQGAFEQSAIHPGGPAAAEIAWIWWAMFWSFSAVFVLVLALLAYALFGRRSSNEASPPLGKRGFIAAGGIVLPLVVVTPLLIASLETSSALRMPEDALTIHVDGHMWWWDVRYPEQGIVTANELHIPVGQPVRLELTSSDVIHSFWAPSLNGKRDLIPGIRNTFWIQADREGVYRGQCAEYCGKQHARMNFLVVAMPPADFEQWVAARQAQGAALTERQSRGEKIFFQAGCAKCHAVGGTAAEGQIGPDLTHIGSRQTLGAGLLPNNRGNLGGWISNAPALKPGVKMPATYLSPEDLFALVDYLESLQ